MNQVHQIYEGSKDSHTKFLHQSPKEVCSKNGTYVYTPSWSLELPTHSVVDVPHIEQKMKI